MSGVNRVILVGNVGKDPEVRYLDNNVCVAKFSVATSESYKNKEGQKVESTEWHNIVLWRGLAEIAEKYVRKGSRVYLEGKIKSRSWEDKEGKKHYATDIVCDNMTLLDRKGDNNGGATISSGPAAASKVEEAPLPAAEPTDDLPF
jgi:single-strand DNA-binding protein